MAETRNLSKNKIDMLNGPVAVKILLFALPLAASGILQQFFNAADIAVVGKFAGDDALAAVGANGPVVNLFVGAFIGIAVGTNVLIAQRIGRGENESVSDVVHTSILFGIISGIVLSIICIILTPILLKLIGVPEQVRDMAGLYIRIYFAGMPFAITYNFGAAILRSIGDTRRPMYCLIFSGIVNLGLNLIFVLVFKMSVAGVAIATDISNIVSASLVWIMLTRETSVIKLEPSRLHINKAALVGVLKLGGPAAIQSMVFSLSNICIQAGINSIGKYAIAGSAAAVNFEIFDFYMVTAFNQAAVTFIGQNFAAGKTDRCRRITKMCVLEALCCTVFLITIFFVFDDFWIGLYTSEPAVVKYAKIRMTHVLIFHWSTVFYEVVGSILRGQGKSMTPALITIIGSVGFRVLWISTVFKIWNSYEMLMNVYPCSWILTITMMVSAFVYVSKQQKKKSNQGTR